MNYTIKTKPKGADEAVEVTIDIPMSIKGYVSSYSEEVVCTILEQHIIKAARAYVKVCTDNKVPTDEIQALLSVEFSPIPAVVKRKLDTAKKAAEGLNPTELREHLRWLERHVKGTQ